MTTLGQQQFGGYSGVPKPRGGDHGGARPLDKLSHHPEHGPVGSLSAIARELGVNPPALHMHRRRRADFPSPLVGTTYALTTVSEFRNGANDDDGDGGD